MIQLKIFCNFHCGFFFRSIGYLEAYQLISKVWWKEVSSYLLLTDFNFTEFQEYTKHDFNNLKFVKTCFMAQHMGNFVKV